jgi:glycerol-3-phosphate acyltransferase PlsY
VDIVYTVLLALGAFLLGAVPFSVIIGRKLLRANITEYGDGNPGAANVFRAGNIKTGLLAVVLDVAKGVPFVWMAHSLLDMDKPAIIVIALCAVLGHAFSPFLHWRGGKAISVTFGVMLALPQHDILLAFIIGCLLGFLLIEINGWAVLFGAAGTFAFLVITTGISWESFLMFFLLAILVFKHLDELHTLSHLRGGILSRLLRRASR